jgi:hypothetical protein
MPKVRRRWVVRLHAQNGDEAVLVLAVPQDHGTVHISLSGTAAVGPKDISRVRSALAEAQVQALRDRGSW